MEKVCRICKIQFRTDDNELTLCEDCVKAIVLGIAKSEEQSVNLGKTILNLPASSFGIGGSGTVADFFRREINQVSK